jgi:hypothetical protein
MCAESQDISFEMRRLGKMGRNFGPKIALSYSNSTGCGQPQRGIGGVIIPLY